MNKSDLIESVATLDDVESKASAKRIVDFVIESLVKGIASGDPVTIAGLGTFHVVAREARTGRNPQTGDAITIPAKNVPKFRAGSKLKEVVNA